MLDEAIEVAHTYVMENGLNMTQLEIKALKLGIEALERVKTVREDWHRPHPQPVIDVIEEAVELLPSETEGVK